MTLDPAQKAIIREEIRSLDNQISAVQRERIELMTRLSALSIALTLLRYDRARLESPVLRLPFEILSHIFNLVHRKELVSLYPGATSTFPITISHVSQHFRTVAIRTSALWTVIRTRDFDNTRLDYLKTCLQRSGTLPLNLLFDRMTCPLILRSGVMQAMTLIQPSLCRLERFTATFQSNGSVYHVTRNLCAHPAPQLTSLKLSYSGDDDDDDDHMRIPTRRHACDCPPLFPGNKLTELKLRSIPIPWWRCDFKNLVVLVLDSYSGYLALRYQEFRTIIENSPSLRRLRLASFGFLPKSPPNMNVGKSYALNLLDRLELSKISLDNSLEILSGLHAPSLGLLDIADMLIDEDYTGLMKRIAGPPALFPNLAVLCLEYVRLNGGEGIEALEHAYAKLIPELCIMSGDSVSFCARRQGSKEYDIEENEWL